MCRFLFFRFVLTSALILSATSCRWGNPDSAAAVAQPLYPFKINKKWGYMDSSGRIRIKPAFDDAAMFVEDRAAVRIGEKAGFVDKKGNFIVGPKFDAVQDFREGFARVRVGEKWGFIDKDGAFRVPPTLQDNGAIIAPEMGSFFEGLTRMLAGNDISRAKWGFIDSQGRFVINPRFDGAAFFEGGIAAVEVDGKWGFIDKSGNLVISPQYDEIGDSGEIMSMFSEGLTPVRIGTK